MLELVAQHRISELRSTGASLVNAISALLEDGRASRAAVKAAAASRKGSGKKS